MARCSIEEASSKEIIYIKYFFTLGYLILHQMRKFTHKNRYTNGVLLQETDVRDKKCLNALLVITLLSACMCTTDHE